MDGRGGEDVQCAQQEDGGQGDLLPEREAEAPYWGHGEHEDDDVEEDVCDRGAEQGRVVVDAFAVRVGSDPGGFDGYALEDVGEYDGDAPAGNEREDDVAGVFEGFADTEEAVVEEEDGYFDEGYADAVEDFVGDGRLWAIVRDVSKDREWRE